MSGREKSIVLINPKFILNLAEIRRHAACFGFSRVIYTGNRLDFNIERLPRPLRQRCYESVPVIKSDRPFDLLNGSLIVAIENRSDFVPLPEFVHPPLGSVAYVFGPEDSGLSRGVLCQCHSFVRIPAFYSINLAHAVSIVLYSQSLSYLKSEKP